jgi:hypothetical protein
MLSDQEPLVFEKQRPDGSKSITTFRVVQNHEGYDLRRVPFWVLQATDDPREFLNEEGRMTTDFRLAAPFKSHNEAVDFAEKNRAAGLLRPLPLILGTGDVILALLMMNDAEDLGAPDDGRCRVASRTGARRLMYPSLEEVHAASQEQLLRWYRFLPSPSQSFETLVLSEITARLSLLGGITPELSKRVGWR